MNGRVRFVACSIALLLAGYGCGAAIAPAFDPSFPDNDAERGKAIAARLAAATPDAAQGEPVLVATSEGKEPTLFAYDLGKASVRWRVAFRAESRPELLGDLVLSSSQAQLWAFDRASGGVRWRAPIEGCGYLGAARDGDRLFVACRGAGATSNGRVLALDARDGRALWQRDARGEVGRPAARDGLVLVPWQHQNLSILDAANGRELERLRSADDVIDWVRADARGVFFGQRALYRLGERGYAGTRDSASYVTARGETLPANPPALESAFAPQPGTRSARGRIALYLEPEAVAGDGVRIARDCYYFVFYRYVFAYGADGVLRWSRLLDRDAIAGQAVADGLALALEDGQLLLLAADNGATRMQQRVGVALGSATLQASGLAGLGEATPEAAEVVLRHGLTAIALDTDARLVPARAYAVERLALLADPEVTRELLDIYSQSSTPPDLKRAAADALRTRRTGLEYLIDALLDRYDFLDQTRPAPLSVIVPALVDAHETRAVPNLIARLLDCETPSAVVPALVHAIAVLGDDSVAAPLLGWLRMYRADSSLAAQPDALIEAARAVNDRGGAQAPTMLASITRDGRATPALVAGIAALTAEHEPAAEAAPVVAASAPQVAPRVPDKLEPAAVNAVFAEHADDLRACAADELTRNPKLGQIRIAFIAESDGGTHALSFAPNSSELADCLYSKITNYRFPRFRSGRQVATFTFALHAPAAPSAPAAKAASQPWWAFYEARGAAAPALEARGAAAPALEARGAAAPALEARGAAAPALEARGAAAPAQAASAGEPWWQAHQWLAPQLDVGTTNATPQATGAAPAAAAKNAAPAPAAPAQAPPPAAVVQAPPAAVATAPAPATPTTPATAAPAPAAAAPAQDDAWWVPATSATPPAKK